MSNRKTNSQAIQSLVLGAYLPSDMAKIIGSMMMCGSGKTLPHDAGDIKNETHPKKAGFAVGSPLTLLFPNHATG